MMPASEIMKDFRAGTLHSGKGGPIVRKKKQAKAIQMSYARKEGADIPDKSGANYVSRNDLHVQPTAAKVERVPYKPVPEGYPEGYSTVADLGRGKMNACEAERVKNNVSRDNRTNLGRGKANVDGDVQ